MNVAEILKYCPKDTKLYSTVFGEVKFSEVYPNNMIVVIIKDILGRICKIYFNNDIFEKEMCPYIKVSKI